MTLKLESYVPIVDSGGMKISFPDGMSLEEIQDVLSTYANAAIDVGSTITSGAIAEPIAGLTALATNDPDAVEGMTSRMTYQPRTEAGRKALNAIGQGFQSAASAIGLDHMPGYWRDRVVPALQDTAGTTAGSALAAGSLAALVGMMEMGGGGRIRGLGRYQSGGVGSDKPLYHGSGSSAPFSEFEPGRAGLVYFSEDPAYAEHFATGGLPVAEYYLKKGKQFDSVGNPKHKQKLIKMFNDKGGWKGNAEIGGYDSAEDYFADLGQVGRKNFDYDARYDEDWEILDNLDTDVLADLQAEGFDSFRFREQSPNQEFPEGVVAQAVADPSRVRKGSPSSESPLARDYPKPGRPVVQVDKKTGKEFKGKGLSKKELALQKQREAINAEIIKPGIYEEYFPLSERYYADPSYYDLPGNTLTDTLAKTPEKRAEKVALFDTPDARSSLNRAYDEAANDLSRDWYATGQLQDKFIDILGPDEGSKMYKERFADAMAATTGGASPGANLAMAAYGNFLRGKGKSPPTNAYNMPHPIGGRYVSGNMKIYDKLINEGVGLTPGDYPKRHNFSANFLGDVDRATIDEQMTLGMYDGKYKAPPNLTYGVIENVVSDEAAKRGLSPANMQDAAWAGFKGRAEAEKRGIEPGTEEYTQILQSQGKPMMQWFNEMIERTARVTGKSQDEVLEGFVRANMPMYGAGGLAAGLGAMQSEENPGAL